MARASERNPPSNKRAPTYPWIANYPKGVDWHAKLPERPLFALLDDAVARYSDGPFLDFLGRKFTYSGAADIVEMLAGAFEDMGVKRGVKVGLLLPNSPYFVFCFFAILKAGGTAVLYNPLLAANEIARQIEDSETDFMVTLDVNRIYNKIAHVPTAGRLKKLVVCRLGQTLPLSKRLMFALLKPRERIRIPHDDLHVPIEKLLHSQATFEPREINPRKDIAALIYTGGTTGMPKGVCLSHCNLYANACQSALGLPSAEHGKERVLAIIPFCHAFGMTAVLNTSIALGAEIFLLPSFDPGEVLRTIHRKRPTMFLAVPTIFAVIANHPKAADYDLSSLRLCTCGADVLSPDIKRSFQRLSSCDFVQGYGLTECSPIVTSGSPEGLDKPKSIGVPLPRTVVGILSLEDKKTQLGANRKGEICVKGPQVMMEYWKRPEATAQILKHRWLHTGDVGFMDEEGYFYLVDRLKDMIITGGYNVYPKVVEAAIAEHKAVQEVAVVGLPHPRWGEQVTAFIVKSGDFTLSEAELFDFLQDRLSSYEMPKAIHFLSALPKSAMGKVLKAELGSG